MERTIFYYFRYVDHHEFHMDVSTLELNPKNPEVKGGVTIAVRETSSFVYFGAAKCSREDVFERKYGRTKAEGISKSKMALKIEKPISNEEIKNIVFSIKDKLEGKLGIAQALSLT